MQASAQLAAKPLDVTRDATKPFNGEEQIEKTLVSNPLKLYLDVEKEFDAIRDKAQDLLGLRIKTRPAGPTSPSDMPSKLECNGLRPGGSTHQGDRMQPRTWEDLGNGYVTKSPKKKRTSAQVIPESEPDDHGRVRLRVNPQNAGPAPRIHFAEDAPVTEGSTQLKESPYSTVALRVNFLVRSIGAVRDR